MKKIKGILIFLIIIVVIIFSFIIFIKNNKTDEKITFTNNIANNEKTERVNNATEYFTVQSCVNKYLTYAFNKDKDSLYKLLDDSYIKESDIKPENVLNYIEDVKYSYSFDATEINYVQLKEVKKYYVSGYAYEEDIDGLITNRVKIGITIILDMENKTFSVIPYGYGGNFYE